MNKALLSDFAKKYEKQIRVQKSGGRGRRLDNELKVKRADLLKTEARIRNLIDQMSDGEADGYPRVPEDACPKGLDARALALDLSAVLARRICKRKRPEGLTAKEQP